MKKFLIIIILTPFLSFSQSEKEYDRIISISKFLYELYDALDNNRDVEFNKTKVVFSPEIDNKYLYHKDSLMLKGKERLFDRFNKNRIKILLEKVFLPRNDLVLKESSSYFKESGSHYSIYVTSDYTNSNIVIKDCDLGFHIWVSTPRSSNLKIIDSKVKKITIVQFSGSLICSGLVADQINLGGDNINLINSKISKVSLAWDTISSLNVENSEINNFNISQCVFSNKFNTNWSIDEDEKNILLENSYVKICNSVIDNFEWNDNSSLDYSQKVINDSLFFNYMKNNSRFSLPSYLEGGCDYHSFKIESRSSHYISEFNIDEYEQGKSFKIIEHKSQWGNVIDTIFIKPISHFIKDINIRFSKFKSISLIHGNTRTISISNSEIKESLQIDKSFKIDSVFGFFNNILPNYSSKVSVEWENIQKIYVNTDRINRVDFFDGMSTYSAVDDINRVDFFDGMSTYNAVDHNHYRSLISSYMTFIKVFEDNGEKYNKYLCKLAMKDVETAEVASIYKSRPSTKGYFKWKGNLFLKYYCKYGLDPFQGLFYCFKMILYFALFYFIFYNEWDKIDRGFLIKRFNSVMDYFTTEKRIEDFYSSNHNQEITTFTDFKETLNTNKVFMPSLLGTLAKPIYKVSLFRYRILNFFYKKAEFMAGRKWIDLQKKDRFWIGTLTLFLTILYLLYLFSLRALNSVILSINAFSTLGFGAIPVRGFTKYVAVIEGFIGWFLLSIFIVALINQMMSM